MYEVEVYGIDNDLEIVYVHDALDAAGIPDPTSGLDGMYSKLGYPTSVWVYSPDVTLAVEIINRMGYQTDEDTTI